MKRIALILSFLIIATLPAIAQADRHDVRAGNRRFRRDKFKQAEIDYRKAAVKDSTSIAAQYDLASSLYRQKDYDGASKALESIKGRSDLPSQYHYNAGDVALQKKDYKAAVDAFKHALLLNPGDLDAKENYIYAKKMLKNQQNGGGGGGSNDKNKNQDQKNKDQNNQGNNQNQNQQGQQGQQPQEQQGQQGQEAGIPQQQAQQMLRAIQSKENDTQDKVNREKAALLQSQQKEKNW